MATIIRHKKGESYCGDRCLTLVNNDSTLYVVIDGIGHGEKASKVADIATHSITRAVEANSSLTIIIQACEIALANTRGIVVSFVMVVHSKCMLEYYSLGNIESLLISPKGIINLKRTPGIFSAKKSSINLSVLQYPAGSYILMYTDGINEITGQIRQQLSNMNSRHIVNILGHQME